jgi:hypothetical protein
MPSTESCNNGSELSCRSLIFASFAISTAIAFALLA